MCASLVAMLVEGTSEDSPEACMLHAHNCYTVTCNGDLEMLMRYVALILNGFAHDALSISCYVRASNPMRCMQLVSRRQSAMSTSQLPPDCLPSAQETQRKGSQLRMVLSLCQPTRIKAQHLRTQHCRTLRQ